MPPLCRETNAGPLIFKNQGNPMRRKTNREGGAEDTPRKQPQLEN
jgi:hypothetical protein